MSNRIECPECGGPLVDGGGDDLRCVECGFTREDFSEIDDVEDQYGSDDDEEDIDEVDDDEW